MLRAFFNLQSGEEDKLKVLKNVRSNIYFRGANLWILACAILVASIGLNVNSSAVIIGAMLISPLMGPIIGAGFSLGIYDFVLLKRSLKNLWTATWVSLLVSSVYFYISPFKEAQSEILARTSPNLYDILIAFFGGLAGAIAITRVEKGLPVAGVAIATALMPPLCTAGYGLATDNYMYFFGAFFLYIINCAFICISTFLIVKFLKYPIAGQVNKRQASRIKYTITGIMLLLIIPSAFFAWRLYQKQNFEQRVQTFLREEFENKGDVIIYKKTRYLSKPKTIEIAFLTKQLTAAQKDSLKKKLVDYKLADALFIIKQDTSNVSALSQMNSRFSGKRANEEDKIISELKKKVDENNYPNTQLFDEAKVLFPAISSFSVANHDFQKNDTANIKMPVLVYTVINKFSDDEKAKLRNWLQKRLSLDTLALLETRAPKQP